MTIQAVQCPDCKDIIFSRAAHDLRQCSCQSTFIDGGRSYTRVGFGAAGEPLFVTLQLGQGVDDAVLFNDWNERTDIFGLFKTKYTVYDKLYRYVLNRKGRIRRVQRKVVP